MAQGLTCSARVREDETSWDQIPAAAFCSSRNILDKWSTSFGWGYGGDIASVEWQVKLCDPISHASYGSAETVVTALNTL